MGSMRDALKTAFQSAEESSSGVKAGQENPVEQRRERPIVAKTTVIPALSEAEFRRLIKLGGRLVPNQGNEHCEQINKPQPVRPRVNSSASSAFASPAKPTPTPAPICTLEFSPHPRCRLDALEGKPNPLLTNVEKAGAVEQCRTTTTHDEREVAFGLDFGTSSVKVVIGDMALDKAFAVPFCKADGLGAFLLPTRVYQTGDVFSLIAGDVVHRDLKLSFMAQPDNRDNQIRIVAFLALVIARARGWLFTKHLLTYKNTNILWKLSVGLPTANSLEIEIAGCLRRLIYVAWQFAATPQNLTEQSINEVLNKLNDADNETSSLDVAVVPEIAAQIYGFVVSNSFDKKAANIYLMVDVGAGTVDSSLFKVKPGKGGKWDFEFYTAAVEPHGVSNLHRHRVNWWSHWLENSNASKDLVAEMIASKFDTDHQIPLPEKFTSYFDGIKVKMGNSAVTPDVDFFDNRVVTQVRGKTIWRAWKNNLLDQGSLQGVPFFMCGGGARMEYYRALEAELAPKPSFLWLQAEAWTMGVPGDLIAEGLDDADYDRISVAYGLSRLEVGKVIKAVPLPIVAIEPVDTWRENYVDKDQC